MMKSYILSTLVVFVLNVDLFVFTEGRFCNNPLPPLCADDCEGNGYYLNEDRTDCIQCQQCSPGEELNKPCGNGINGDAVCVPCRGGYFTTASFRQCTPCKACVNAEEIEPCRLTQDRVCGDCLPGFVRSSDRFSADPDACPDRCSDLPRNTPQCREWWKSQNNDVPIEEELHPEEAPVKDPVEVVPLDGIDPCEPVPPRCIDRCADGSYYLGSDGLCKACLQCQPGEELNKVCGRGKNGDAHCQRCPEGTFSVNGLGRCTPCRICVNTVATECTATRDSECGQCLPGFYQDADGFFPDHAACPNKCPDCPNVIPQCQDWCESGMNQVTERPTELNDHEKSSTLAFLAEDDYAFREDYVKDEVNDEANTLGANHVSYTTMFTILALLIAFVIIMCSIAIFVIRYMWKKTRPTPSISGESTLLQGSSVSSSPGSSPTDSPSIVYKPTTYPISPEEDAWELMNFLRKLPSALSISRPASRNLSDEENRSSAVSTPVMNLKRHLDSCRDVGVRHHLERQLGVDQNDSLTRLPNPENREPWFRSGESDAVNYHPDSKGQFYMQDEKHRQKRSTARPLFDQESGPEMDFSDLDDNPKFHRFKVVPESDSGNISANVKEGVSVRRRKSIAEQPWISRASGPQQGVVRDRREKSRNGSNGQIVIEPEAAVFPSDSPCEDRSKLSACPPESATPSQTTQAAAPQQTGKATKGNLDTLPEKSSDEFTSQNTPFVGDRSATGNSPPITLNINLTTAQGIEKLQIGDVHNLGVEPSESINADSETTKLLNVNMMPNKDASADTHGNDSDDDVERDKLL